MTILDGGQVRLRPPTRDDTAELARIRATPEVHARWRGGADPAAALAAVEEDFAEVDAGGSTAYVVELDGRIVGWIQWSSEDEPDYRHASIDIYLDPAVHGRGVGTDAVRTLARHLVAAQGHHRIVIDPAADNAAAIRAYEKVGFRPVGIMRRYERGSDGTWHDGLLMDLLADELIDDDTMRPLRERVELLRHAYRLFNERRVDDLLALMTDDVAWPDVTNADVLHGHDAIRAHWLAQFAVADPRLEPTEFLAPQSAAGTAGDEVVAVIAQRILDLDGNLLAPPARIFHRYAFTGDLVRAMVVYTDRATALDARRDDLAE